MMEVLTEKISLDIPKISSTEQDEVLLLKDSVKFLNVEKNDLKTEITALNSTIKELQKKIEEKEKTYKTDIQNIQEELKKIKEIEKYVKDKLIVEDNEKEKEIKNKTYFRETEITLKSDKDNKKETKVKLSFQITIYLYKEKIKFQVKEIQDYLENNPIIYENNSKIENFDKISYYYMKSGGIEAIYKFFCELLEGKKDTIIKKDNCLIIKTRFPLGNTEEEISIQLTKVNISL